MNYFCVVLLLLLAAPMAAQAPSTSTASKPARSTPAASTPSASAPALRSASDPRPRVIVSTDIGGTDPDDFQSMVHFLVYADMFDIEGLISSPYGPGRREHILQVIDRYEIDYPNLKTYSDRYPTPDALRGLSKQGAITSGRAIHRQSRPKAPTGSSAPRGVTIRGRCGFSCGAGSTTSRRRCTMRRTSFPSCASTSSAAPTRCGASMRTTTSNGIIPTLWMIEANATYRGWFTGGNQSGEWGNAAFVASHIRGHGALGDYFATHLERDDQDGRHAIRRLPAARRRDVRRSHAAVLGRHVRAHLGRTQDHVRSPHDRSRHRRSLRRRRIQAPGARRQTCCGTITTRR